MNYKMVGRFMSLVIITEAVFMVPAWIISLIHGEATSITAFATTIIGSILVGLLMFMLCRRAEMRFYAREGLVSAGLGWAIMSLVGCMPFFISGEIPAFIDAYFETVSGFTTTGASILTNVEAMSYGMLYWRSFTHWLGGMGVMVFWRSFLPVARATALPCICFEQKVRDQMSANWCHVCARQRRSYIPCMWP